MTKYAIKFYDTDRKQRTVTADAEGESLAEAQVKKDNPGCFVSSVEEVYGDVTYAVEEQRDGTPVKRYYGYEGHHDADQAAHDKAQGYTHHRTFVVIERTQTGVGTYTEREITA